MTSGTGWFSRLVSGGRDRGKGEERPAQSTGISILKFDPSVVTKDVEDAVMTALEGCAVLHGREQHIIGVIHNAVMDGVRCGYNRGQSFTILAKMLPDWGKSELGELVHFGHQVARTQIDLKRDLEFGYEEATWRWPGAPCVQNKRASEAERRRADAHKAMNGKKFQLREGALIGNRHIWPGQEWACGCSWRPILKGWNDAESR